MSTEDNQPTEVNSSGRWGMLAAWLFVIALLAVIGSRLASVIADNSGGALGSAAAEFTLTTFEGDEYVLSDLRGKVVLINFWASWCIPCEEEAPILEGAWEYYRDRVDVLFLGIAYADTESKSLEFLEKFGVTYPNGPDLGTRISQAYVVKAVPETFIIDQNGILVYAKIGQLLSLDELIREIDALLES
ncbi:MAG: TlpA family protein disulfide reductase [Chloroflexi bacterium]|nr:TlpA family protein disulfide reductase [Chloroflexota bacterium]